MTNHQPATTWNEDEVEAYSATYRLNRGLFIMLARQHDAGELDAGMVAKLATKVERDAEFVLQAIAWWARP